MTCGSLPPGTGNGKAFVCDPKLLNRNEVTSTVKLKFFAINQQPILCIRQMSVRRKNNKLEFKKLDQQLKTKNAEGKEVVVSHTSNEIDRQVPELLGVSKAVLENVIFCHQEDSMWPFRDNATLKEIFDELFETTKFTKLYETLQKLLKDNKKKLKDEKSALDTSRVYYETLVSDMRSLQSIIEDIRKNMTQIKTEKKHKEMLQQALRQESFEEKMRVIEKEKTLNEYKLEEAKKIYNALLEELTDRDHPIDGMEKQGKMEFLEGLKGRLRQVEEYLDQTKGALELKQREYNELKEITVDFDVSEEKKEITRLVNYSNRRAQK